MATDWERETRSQEKQTVKLAASTSSTVISLADQTIFKLGTNRRTEVMGKIGNKGQGYQAIFNTYLDSL